MVKNGKTDCSPAEAGYHEETLNCIDSHLQRLINEKKILAGAYLLARHGKVFAHRTMGKLSALEDTGDFQPDSIRAIASVSKMFTAVSIMQLVEKGKLNLDQSVSDFIKEFDNDMYGGVSIFELLTHTSGIKADNGGFLEPYPEEDNWDKLTKDNWIKKGLTGPMQYQPGTVWNYCSFGFQVLGELVARISGMDFVDYVIKNIFEPLGMEDTHFFVPKEKHDRVCVTEEWNKHVLLKDKKDLFSTSILAGGGIHSTLTDLWKFAQMFLNNGTSNNNRILGRKTVEAMTKKQIVDFPSYNWSGDQFKVANRWSYGYGVQVAKHHFQNDSVFGHEGYGGAQILIDPEEDFIYIGLSSDSEFCQESWHNTLAVVWAGIN